MKSVWRPSRHEGNDSVQLPSAFAGMPQVILDILQTRGCTDEGSLKSVLEPRLADLKDPFSILGMEAAVARLVQAFRSKEKICIYADFDLDGTSGLALLRSGLLGLGFENVSHYQPKRLSEGYGFHPEVVTELQAQGVSLIVTVDVGITAFKACDQAKELGVDVILTDHHQPAETLPQAYVVVNPNQKACESDLKYLCGAGVAFYLVRALKRGLVDQKLINENLFDLRSVLDCFTIATLTDMVPIIEDNRVLVKAGLRQLENTRRPGLRALLETLGMQERPLSGQDVSIRFAPKLNALSRMEMGLLPIDLYLIEDEALARKAVKEVLQNNQTRVSLQADSEKEALQALSDWPYEGFVALASSQFHRGIVGLIATKISQGKNRPAFIGSKSPDGQIVGSARSGDENDLSVLEALEACSQYLDRFGGHHAAAGFELHESTWQSFVKELGSHFDKVSVIAKPREMIYDAEVPVEQIGENLMKWFDLIGPFGQSFSVPILRIQNLQVQSLKELSGGHLKFKLSSLDTHRSFEALWFSPPSRLKEIFVPSAEPVEILGEIQWNYFAGRKTVQVLIREMRKLHDH